MLLVRGELHDIQRLRTLLDHFAQATGLQINYPKSTVVPIHISEEAVEQCVSVLGMLEGRFPPKHILVSLCQPS
jgi:hypothetical protein